jgi:hypothetical protein
MLPDELPSGTDWERGLAMIVMAYEGGGMGASIL